MEPDETDRPADGPARALLILLVLGVTTLGLALLVRRLRRSVGSEVADLAGEGAVALTEAIVDELFAS